MSEEPKPQFVGIDWVSPKAPNEGILTGGIYLYAKPGGAPMLALLPNGEIHWDGRKITSDSVLVEALCRLVGYPTASNLEADLRSEIEFHRRALLTLTGLGLVEWSASSATEGEWLLDEAYRVDAALAAAEALRPKWRAEIAELRADADFEAMEERFQAGIAVAEECLEELEAALNTEAFDVHEEPTVPNATEGFDLTDLEPQA